LFFAAIHLSIAIWRAALLALAAGPLVYYAAATFSAWRFFRRERARALPEFAPPVSILKPVHGVDFGSYENFASFCRQDYPGYEILFAVNDESDPAVPVIRRLMNDFPNSRIRLLSNAPHLGSNQKVNNLALLAREAQHEIFVMTDGDVRVEPNYLREVVAPLANTATGAVTSFYRGLAQQNLGAKLEAIGAASDFFGGVILAAATEGISFALGASIATTRQWLDKIGGFESFADMLADDYVLGNRIAKAGGRVEFSRNVVWTIYPAQTFRGFWQHQVRWARTIRLSRPASYVGLLFTHGLPWTVLAVAIAPSWPVAWVYVAAYLILRSAMAYVVGVWGVHDPVTKRSPYLLPLRDLIYFLVWLAAFGSSRVVWGQTEYRLENGRMIPTK
jgi:ceramide glucosyltransferase